MKTKIKYSIELLRGILATNVAICHYYLSYFNNIHLELISSLSVEIFFVISGFVLAPQIIKIFESNKFSNFKIFLFRRFLRTLPAYFFYLGIISLILGKIFSLDFFKFFFFIQNFFEINPESDYYPIAWSLSVEEWFYLLFTPILLFSKRIFNIKNIFKFIILWFSFFYLLKFIYFSFNDFNWGEDIRRVTVFRLDSIVIGLLFYLFKDKFLSMLKKYNNFLLPLIIILYFFIYFNLSTKSIFIVEIIFFTISILAVFLLALFITNEEIFSSKLNNFSYFFGSISYSIYLSHMLLIIIISSKDNIEMNLFNYLLFLFLLSFASRKFIEEPFLKNRPQFKS